MADNVTLPGTGAIVATDELAGGLHVQYVKLGIGGDGVLSPVTAANPLPVTAAALPLPTGAATETTLAALNTKMPASPAQDRTTAAAPTAVRLSDGSAFVDPRSIRALTSADVVSINGTVPVSGPLTDAQLRATAVAVSGPLTDAQLRATAVPVSAAALPLPTGAAADATVAAVRDRLPATLFDTTPLDTSSGMVVRQAPADLTRYSFSNVIGSGLSTPGLSLLQTGAGMAVSQSAGNLVITTGTAANAETLIRSTRVFRGAHALRYGLQLSQRVANNAFSVELADLIGEGLAFTVISATQVDVTIPSSPFTAQNVGHSLNLSAVAGLAGAIPGRYAIASVTGDVVRLTVAGWPASGSGTCTLWGWNWHRILYDGTVATTAQYDAQRRGWASGNSAVTTNTSVAPGHVGEIKSIGSFATFADALAATSLAYQFTGRGSRLENLPDDDRDLYLFVRVLNGTAAPASTTTLTLRFLSVEMFGRNKMIVAGADQSGIGMSAAVQVANFPATQAVSLATNTPTLAAGTNLAGDVGLQYRANATGAALFNQLIAAGTANPTIVKGSAGRLLGYHYVNNATAVRYVKFHNQATAPTVGTGVVLTIGVPPNGGVASGQFPGGLAFGTGIGLTTTVGAAANDTTVVAANDLVGYTAFA
jgi:hypothetical protein